MAAFNDYLDLQTAVVEAVKNTAIVDVFPRLTALAEARMSRRLRCGDQMRDTTLTVASGTANLPGDFAEAIGLYDAAGYELVQQPTSATRITDSRGFYSIYGDTLRTQNGTYVLAYYAVIPTITGAPIADNWLLLKYPGLYLYEVAYEAAKYLMDVEQAKSYQQLAAQEYTEAQAFDASQRYSRARVRVQGVTP